MKYTFDSIAGYKEEKQELKMLCEIFQNRQKYESKGAKLPKGIVFYGGAGNGKTLFAKVLASECGLNVFKIDLTSGTNNISQKIRQAFEDAQRINEPSMVFFDELDKVLPNPDEEYYTDRAKTILTQLLTLIDGMDSRGSIVFVATCNYYGSLPETIVRPGRIDKKIRIGNPCSKSREEIIKHYIAKTNCKFEMKISEIVKLTVGFSGAGIETLINECVLRSDENNFVSIQLIKSKIQEIKKENIPKRRSEQQEIVYACRNIGSFVVSRMFNDGTYILKTASNTVCNTFFDNLISSFDRDYDDDYEPRAQNATYSKTQLKEAITVIYGGYVAQELVLGEVYDNLRNQLATVDCILDAICESGMLGLGLRYSDYRESNILSYTPDHIAFVNRKYDEITSECYQMAKELVLKNLDLIKSLIPILVDREAIADNEAREIVKSLGGIKK